MSDTVLASEGVRLVKENKYAEGIAKLTHALESRSAPMWLLERSKAYMRTNEFDLALYDAEKALSIAYQRANRDLMVEAQIRRAITLFRMGRYADADVCAFWAMQLVGGAKASENDGQQNKVDGNGDYVVTRKEAEDANKPNKEAGLSAAMGGRTKDASAKGQAFTWRIQALSQMEQLEPGAAGRKVNVVKYPTPASSPPPKKAVQTERVVELDDSEPEDDANKPKIPAAILKDIPATRSSSSSEYSWEKVWNDLKTIHNKNEVRTDFYQTDSSLNVSFFVKNVSKDDLKVDAQEQKITLRPIPVPSGNIVLDLAGKIKPEEIVVTVKSMKIELILKKATPGKWGSLRSHTKSALDKIAISSGAQHSPIDLAHHAEKLGYKNPQEFERAEGQSDQEWYQDLCRKLKLSEEDNLEESGLKTFQTVAQEGDIPKPTAAAPAPAAPAKAAGPAYPTSSKSGPKNWDNMDLDVDDEADAGNVDDFFKKLYEGADPDTRRAMMKSYVESNGTSLSTNWAEAKDKTYDTQPPDSMEAKKWDK
ncbi:SGS domain-containing protein [Xylariales sp. PMI_506]|nr:SGS domain-containing protein [Xylariales sp. PMI_506]